MDTSDPFSSGAWGEEKKRKKTVLVSDYRDFFTTRDSNIGAVDGVADERPDYLILHVVLQNGRPEETERHISWEDCLLAPSVCLPA